MVFTSFKLTHDYIELNEYSFKYLGSSYRTPYDELTVLVDFKLETMQ